MPSLRGQLLIAAPTLLDPNFARTVVLVAEHTDEGALGLVLNRPTELPVAETAPGFLGMLPDDDVVHLGGPVQTDGLIVLAELDDPADLVLRVLGDVGILGTDADLDTLVARRARIFAGHSGWGPGQLDAELEDSGWLVGPAIAEDVFTVNAADLWGEVLTRKGGQFALLARMPLDPSVN